MLSQSLAKKRGIKVLDESWDFRLANTKCNNHGFHTYPAMMIPQIAQRLIEEYGKDTRVMLDPFMGSGTSLLEAELHKQFRLVYGIDINPLARLIAKVKTTPIATNQLLNGYNKLSEAIKKERKTIKLKQKDLKTPQFYNINFWFKPEVILDLTIIKNSINHLNLKGKNKEDVIDFFKVAFSETIRNVSNTRNREFKLYKMSEESLKKHNPNTIEVFFKKAQENISSMKEGASSLHDLQISILNEDSRLKTSIPSESVDLILTSPPYGDSRTTVAYGQFSRLALQWLDFDYNYVKNIDKISLGGVRSKNLDVKLNSDTLKKIIHIIAEKDEARAKDVLSFYEDFFLCIKEFDRVMRKGGKLCFVVGNRTVKGINIPTDEIIVELFENAGDYTHIKTIIRNIPSKRMPKSNSPTNIKGALESTMNKEFIIILNKD